MIKTLVSIFLLIFINLSSASEHSNFNYSFIQINHSKINEDNKFKENGLNFSKSINDSFFFTSSFNKGRFYFDPIKTYSYSAGLGLNTSINQITDLVYSFQLAKSREKNEPSGIETDQDTLNASIEIKHIIMNDLEISSSINYTNSAILDNGRGHDISYGVGVSWTLNERLSLISGFNHSDENSLNVGVELSL